MTKLYVALDDTGTTETDLVDNVIDSSCFFGSSLDDLIKVLEDNGSCVGDMDIYVLEVIDKGTIETKYSFISSKKIKSVKK